MTINTYIKDIIQWFNNIKSLFKYDEYIFWSYLRRFDEVFQHLWGLLNESNYYVTNPLSYLYVCRFVNIGMDNVLTQAPDTGRDQSAAGTSVVMRVDGGQPDKAVDKLAFGEMSDTSRDVSAVGTAVIMQIMHRVASPYKYYKADFAQEKICKTVFNLESKKIQTNICWTPNWCERTICRKHWFDRRVGQWWTQINLQHWWGQRKQQWACQGHGQVCYSIFNNI